MKSVTRSLTVLVLLEAFLACVPACQSPPSEPPSDQVPPPGSVRAPADDPAPVSRPDSIDLRPRLIALGLTPRPQGGRGTCSIFTATEAIEFALARQSGHAVRMSPEYLNWAGAKAAGHSSDGNFFHNAIAGFEQSGLCSEPLMPYAAQYDPARVPSAEAVADAARVQDQSRGVIVVHWIVPWVPDRFGVDGEQFAQIKETLARGYPVAAGSGHSRLLVGYRDDPTLPGGGVFLTEDSALNKFDEVTYEFVRGQVADVFWIEAIGSVGIGD